MNNIEETSDIGIQAVTIKESKKMSQSAKNCIRSRKRWRGGLVSALALMVLVTTSQPAAAFWDFWNDWGDDICVEDGTTPSDSVSSDFTGFVVHVHTSCRENAGTDSNIAMVLGFVDSRTYDQSLPFQNFLSVHDLGYQDSTYLIPSPRSIFGFIQLVDWNEHNDHERGNWDSYYVPDLKPLVPGGDDSMPFVKPLLFLQTDGEGDGPYWYWNHHWVHYYKNGQLIQNWTFDFDSGWMYFDSSSNGWFLFDEEGKLDF
jgi:hypothetical protein